jgi:hypothetical protein
MVYQTHQWNSLKPADITHTIHHHVHIIGPSLRKLPSDVAVWCLRAAGANALLIAKIVDSCVSSPWLAVGIRIKCFAISTSRMPHSWAVLLLPCSTLVTTSFSSPTLLLLCISPQHCAISMFPPSHPFMALGFNGNQNLVTVEAPGTAWHSHSEDAIFCQPFINLLYCIDICLMKTSDPKRHCYGRWTPRLVKG